MFLRIFSAVSVLLTSGCGSDITPDSAVGQASAADKIDCALAGRADFQSDCAIARSGGGAVTLRHSDGGFRRIAIGADGAVNTADGSDDVTVVTLTDGRTEISIGTDRYRLPASL